MRIVAGVAGGRRLHAPPGGRMRPTTERVREAVFGALASMGAIDGARVLDLFAGTGALGIEALSRGARAATFVDDDAGAVAAIRSNLQVTGLADAGVVVRRDVMNFLEDAVVAHDPDRHDIEPLHGEQYDIVFADPPYAFDGWVALAARLPAPLAVLESAEAVDLGAGWSTVRDRRYGDTVVTLARRL